MLRTMLSTMRSMYCPWSMRLTTVSPGSSSCIFTKAAFTAFETAFVPAAEPLKMESTTPLRPLSFA